MTLLLTFLAEIAKYLPLENSFAKVQVGLILAKIIRSFLFLSEGVPRTQSNI